MSFSFASVKKLASKLKDSITTNTGTIPQNGGGQTQTSTSFIDSFSGVISSVKSGSIAVGNKIAQTAETFLAKNTEIIDVKINGSQLNYIKDNLEVGYNESCYLKNTVQLEDSIVPKGFYIHSVQGSLFEYASFDMIVDTFFMLRNKKVVSLQFTNNPVPCIERQSSISLSQCMLFLYLHYHAFLTNTALQRKNVISNHYLTLRTLSKFNNFIDFNLFLDTSDMEHLLVVDMLFTQSLRTLCPRPFIQLPSDKSACSDDDLMDIRDKIPRHLTSLVDGVFYFCRSIFRAYQIMPDTDIMTIFCIGKNTPYFTSLVMKWTEPSAGFENECNLAMELYHMNVPRLFYSDLSQLNQSLVSSLSNAFLRCESRERMKQLIEDNTSVTGVEIFAVLLRIINVHLMPEWTSKCMHVVNSTQTTYQKCIIACTFIQFLPFSYRRLFYWLLRCVKDSEQSDKALEALVTFWFHQTAKAAVLPFLQYALHHLYYLFTPTLPSVCALPTVEEESEQSFSMHASFSTLHSLAIQPPAEISDLQSLDQFYEEVIPVEDPWEKEIVWTNPRQWIAIPATSAVGVAKPPVPPKQTPPLLPPKPVKNNL